MFVKLHGSILDSSVWGLDHPTRIVWITMLAMADANGVVSASVDGLARRSVVSLDECKTALETFLSPDQYSRDGTEGQRIESVAGGWLVLNHANYRDRQTQQQAAVAARVRKHRAKKRGVTGNAVTHRNGLSPPEAEAEADQIQPRDQRAKDLTGSARAATPGPLSRGPDRFAQSFENELPDDWEPKRKHAEIALKRGVDLNHVADKYRAWCRSKRRKCADWDADFELFLRNERPARAGKADRLDPIRAALAAAEAEESEVS